MLAKSESFEQDSESKDLELELWGGGGGGEREPIFPKHDKWVVRNKDPSLWRNGQTKDSG